MITEAMRKKAHSPAARKKAVATRLRNQAAKMAGAGTTVEIPLDAVPERHTSAVKQTHTTVKVINMRALAKLIVAVARELP